ncbi:MAG: hypothetical protein JWO57_818 [Pseudonocardiales bacterium]|nr:hypothetical protein [Pseudonocardiales bacterium]
MTQRKPPDMSIPDWIEHQIRAAEADGAFDNLPGAGKPIPDLDHPQAELAWVVGYLRRENADVAALLPPALALAKEVEVLPERLLRERSESRVREIVEDLNQRIRIAHRQPQVGPPMRVRTVPVDKAIEQWRRASADLAVTPEPESRAEATPRRRWFGRRQA